MKRSLALAVLLAASIVTLSAQQADQVTYVEAGKVAEAFATDTFYIVDGTATFVTGGTMVGGKESRPNQLAAVTPTSPVAQTTTSQPAAFEVASVKRNMSGDTHARKEHSAVRGAGRRLGRNAD